MVAGFEPPTSGKILLDGADVGNVPPHRRNVNTVFQSYALFPFLNVAENVGFGMKYKSVPKSESDVRVAEALELVQLSGYDKRRPNQLSGGQQQRVALARALVLRPSVLLLDEPLGALDAKLRRTLQVELGALQKQVGITFLYVTHDQEEALTMSDRLAVMNHGRVVQLGTPEEVYNEPADAYVADFLGVSNLMDARVEPGGNGHGSCRLRLGDFTLEARGGPARRHRRASRSRSDPSASTCIRTRRAVPTACRGWSSASCSSARRRTIFVRLATGSALQALVRNDGATRAVQPGNTSQRGASGRRAASAPRSGRQRRRDSRRDARRSAAGRDQRTVPTSS